MQRYWASTQDIDRQQIYDLLQRSFVSCEESPKVLKGTFRVAT